MKHLIRSRHLLIVVVMAPLAAHAELAVMDEAGMRATTGQAGITIDLAANVSVGEVAYKDEGYIFLNNFQLGGAGIAEAALGESVSAGQALDNLRMTIDVAGEGGSGLGSAWGLAKLDGTGMQPSPENRGDHGVTPVTIEDGDLVISLDAQDHSSGVDFGLLLDDIRLGQSALAPGQGTTGGTQLLSGLKLKGMLGPTDILVEENANLVHINSFFSLEGELTTDWYIPILLNYKDMSFGLKLHNERGQDVLMYTTSSGQTLSYAHLQATIGASAGNDGLDIKISDLSGDMDWTNVTFGEVRPAVGDVYWTDLQIQAELKVYGH